MGEPRAKPGGSGQRVAVRVLVKRVGESAWILHPTEALEQETVDALRDVFLESVDAGAQNVVVDLSGVDAVAPSGAETILAMADLMRGRNATLWLAARRPGFDEHMLRAITEQGPCELLGVSAALDAALDQRQSESVGITRSDPSEIFTRH